MDPVERHRRLTEAFADVCDAPVESQRALVTTLRRQDPILADQLEAMLELDADSAAQLTAQNYAGLIREALSGQIAPPPPPEGFIDRFEVVGVIGRGGAGDVVRVRDPALDRELAMKLLRADALADDAAEHFVAEARTIARLQHPGILPVHELGRLEDGRVWYTMREVVGQSLAVLVSVLHGPAPGAWTLRRLIERFRQACEAVAYAHSQGVVHGDLKPANILVGEFADVLVVDWGLARRATADAPPAPRRAESGSLRPTVAGTPMYMAPELLDPRPPVHPTRDVYALGVTLYTCLAGHAPYDGRLFTLEVLAEAAKGRVRPMRGRLPVPPELGETCRKAMALSPRDRHPDAGALAVELAAWLEGERQRERGRRLVDEALAQAPRAERLRAQAHEAAKEARARLDAVPPDAPLEAKLRGWALEDQALAHRREAEHVSARVEALLRAALVHAPGLEEAHLALVGRYRREHARAEAARDVERAMNAEALLLAHTEALPAGHPERRRTESWLRGDGWLSLATDPPEAQAVVRRGTVVQRRRVFQADGEVHRAPLDAIVLPRGAYLIDLSAPGRDPVSYPVRLGRVEHWEGRGPGDDRRWRLRLPPAGALGEDEVLVLGGWFTAGDDVAAANALDALRCWVPGFVMMRRPVTNLQWLAFLDDLAGSGRAAEAIQHAPLQSDDEPYHWHPDDPVRRIAWDSARAYASWLAERTGRAWRLPSEVEWEKAARGVDGRAYPWGDHLDPTWCAMRDSVRGAVAVDAFPDDVSPYGVRGLGGNVRDWCLEVAQVGPRLDAADRLVLPDAPSDPALRQARVARGGAYGDVARDCRAATRHVCAPERRFDDVGVRLVWSYDVSPAADAGVV